MNNQESTWKSDVSYMAVAIYLILFGGISIVVANNTDFPQDVFKGPYIPLDNWMVLIPLLIIAVIIACVVFKFVVAKYRLNDEEFVMQRIYAGEVRLSMSDLENWQYRKSRGGRSIYSDFLVLVFKEKTLRLNENSIGNLSDLLAILKDKYPQLEIKTKTSNTAINAFVNLFYMAMCVLPWFLIGMCVSEYSQDKPSDIKHLTVTLSTDPIFIEHTHKHDPTTYVMVLKSSETGDFHLTFNPDDSTKINSEQYLHKGDTIQMDILKYDYDVKVAKNLQPNFLDKHFGWNQITIARFWYPSTASN